MDTVRIDLSNFITISLIAFAGVFILNRALNKVGYSQFTTSGAAASE